MTFSAFMDRCLYDPEHGYYTSSGRAVGRSGDFHTSVSVGPVFGEILAAWVDRSWEEMGRPGALALVEQGAHDGQLMADVLAALATRHPAAGRALQPIIIEPLPVRREAQRRRLCGSGGSAGFMVPPPVVSWRSTLQELAASPPPHALFFANELLDAFPVARWRYDGRDWHQLAVGLDEGHAFTWHRLPAPGFQLPWLAGGPPTDLPAGYETETCPGLGPWVRALSRSFGRGRALLFDYGRGSEDYFATHRTAGTLRGYRAHRRCDDPLAAPGETDLTADVNFSQLAGEAVQAGFRVHPAERQGAFLTRLATPRLLGQPPPTAAWLRQFQTLTHPGHLGHSFHALVLEKHPPQPTAAAPCDFGR